MSLIVGAAVGAAVLLALCVAVAVVVLKKRQADGAEPSSIDMDVAVEGDGLPSDYHNVARATADADGGSEGVYHNTKASSGGESPQYHNVHEATGAGDADEESPKYHNVGKAARKES